MFPHKLLCCLAVSAFTLAAVSTADARRFRLGSGVRALGNAAKSYTFDTLSPTQLKTCLVDETALEKKSAALSARHNEIAKQQTEIKLLRSALTMSQERLDRTSQKAVDAFNRQVASFNEKLQAGSAAVAEYNRSVEAQKAETNRFNQTCGGKRYYEDDLISVRAELGVTD